MRPTIILLLTLALTQPALAAGRHGAPHGHHAHAHESQAGAPGDPAQVTRVIEIVMYDTMRFEPDRVQVQPGETVRFRVLNAGRLRHEFVLGSEGEIREHARQMREHPDMAHHDANALSLGPGEQGELIWRFGGPGSVVYACLIPGHLEAGMEGRVHVDGQPE